MDYRAFNVNITSAEGAKGVLDFVNFFSRMRVYAVVSVVGSPPSSQDQETPLAKYFGKNPVWNSPMRFYVEEPKLQRNTLILKIQLRRKRIFGEDEAIGEACVPIAKLFNSCANVMDTSYSYSWLLSPSGGRQGIVYFSYNFNEAYRATVRSVNRDVASPAVPAARHHGRPSAPPLQ